MSRARGEAGSGRVVTGPDRGARDPVRRDLVRRASAGAQRVVPVEDGAGEPLDRTRERLRRARVGTVEVHREQPGGDPRETRRRCGIHGGHPASLGARRTLRGRTVHNPAHALPAVVPARPAGVRGDPGQRPEGGSWAASHCRSIGAGPQRRGLSTPRP
ncbi:hypothetical protein GCM10025872_24880 [Barrientosiimonas endolithica]|uniref:Uncharacterized protein n=1 Tax=Barrientosiimonas endolithica TaxID=1535208 RepID=A0ABN6YRX2_9MICO|nr:hypothetical protein GCM10025872_24880 [Barrientosiimonas endolithica]